MDKEDCCGLNLFHLSFRLALQLVQCGFLQTVVYFLDALPICNSTTMEGRKQRHPAMYHWTGSVLLVPYKILENCNASCVNRFLCSSPQFLHQFLDCGACGDCAPTVPPVPLPTQPRPARKL